MIARIWHGMVLKEKSDDYHHYLLKTGLMDYKTTTGNCGVFLLKREKDNVTHFYTLSFWKDIQSIQLFAGKNHLRARYYPEDQDFLLEFEAEVTHFDVLENPDCFNIPFESNVKI
jgi:hypothetical protein